jgi:hypothetical protein
MPHAWQCAADASLIALQRMHGFKCSGEPHSLQNFATAGFACSQNKHARAVVEAVGPASCMRWSHVTRHSH